MLTRPRSRAAAGCAVATEAAGKTDTRHVFQTCKYGELKLYFDQSAGGQQIYQVPGMIYGDNNRYRIRMHSHATGIPTVALSATPVQVASVLLRYARCGLVTGRRFHLGVKKQKKDTFNSLSTAWYRLILLLILVLDYSCIALL